jgi:hypothetical protein
LKPRFHNVIAACLLIVAIGGNLAILQCFGWMGMLVSYAQQDGFALAIEKTFDGKHPCKICKVVKKSGETEQSKELPKSAGKIDCILTEKTISNWTTTWIEIETQADESARLRFVLPPTPPPKLV